MRRAFGHKRCGHAVGYNAGAVQTRRIPEAPGLVGGGRFFVRSGIWGLESGSSKSNPFVKSMSKRSSFEKAGMAGCRGMGQNVMRALSWKTFVLGPLPATGSRRTCLGLDRPVSKSARQRLFSQKSRCRAFAHPIPLRTLGLPFVLVQGQASIAFARGRATCDRVQCEHDANVADRGKGRACWRCGTARADEIGAVVEFYTRMIDEMRGHGLRREVEARRASFRGLPAGVGGGGRGACGRAGRR